MRTRVRPAEIWRLVKEAFAKWNRDKALRLAASLSFSTVLSLPSLLLFMLAVAAEVFGREAAAGSDRGPARRARWR